MPLAAYPRIARVSRKNRQFVGRVRLSISPRITHFVRLPTPRTHDHAGHTVILITAITLLSQRHIAGRPKLARCSRSVIATASPRSSAGELSARGMTPSASPDLPSIGAHVAFPGGLAQVPGELTPHTVDRLNNRHGRAGRAHRWGLSLWLSRIESPPCPTRRQPCSPSNRRVREIIARVMSRT